MAVDFYRNVNVLIEDFQRRGMHPEVVASSGGEPPRAVQIRLEDGLMIHWDADSRSVWAEGPWSEVQRVEGYIRRRFSGGVRRRLRKPRTLARVVALCIVLAILFGVCVPLLRKRPVVLASPAAPSVADSTKESSTATTHSATGEHVSTGTAPAGEAEGTAEDEPTASRTAERPSSGR